MPKFFITIFVEVEAEAPSAIEDTLRAAGYRFPTSTVLQIEEFVSSEVRESSIQTQEQRTATTTPE